MHLSTTQQQQGPVTPDFDAYVKFANSNANEKKIVAGVCGHKIQLASKGPNSTSAKSTYITKNGMEYEFSQEDKEAIVNHFKRALEVRYGKENTLKMFSPSLENQALAEGLSHKIVKAITKKANSFVVPESILKKPFNQILECKTKLEAAFDNYEKSENPKFPSTPADRGNLELRLAQLMLRHQTLIASFKEATKEDSNVPEIENMLSHPSLRIGKNDLKITTETFLEAAESFIKAARQELEKIGETAEKPGGMMKKQPHIDLANRYRQQATTALITLNDPLLQGTTANSEFKPRLQTISQNLREITALLHQIERIMIAPLQTTNRKPARSRTI